MSDSTSQQSEIFWNKKAAGYAKSTISDLASYNKKLKATQAYLTPQMRVLEFGCGTGSTAIEHAPQVQRIDAMDLSENMLAIARDRARTAGLSNLTFMHGDVASLAAMTQSYDAVLALNVIHLLPNRAAFFEAAARLLEPGKPFISSTACIGETAFRYLKFLGPLGKRLGLLPDLYSIKEAELAEEICAAGFQIEEQWRQGSQGMGVFIIATRV